MSIDTIREEARDWLSQNFTAEIRAAADGSDERKEWARRLADKGWIVPNWPKEYGGAGLSFHEHIALMQEFGAVGATLPPDWGNQSRGMLGPTLLEYGTEEQKQRHLTRIARAEVQWCQGYSEPGSGSDLASVSTKAVLEGDHYVLNGQKMWTSGAELAQWIYALVRTDPEAPKHEGISMVLVDMDQPGVTIRPIKLISGSAHFCETFFDDAITSDLIGEKNHGWAIGKRLLQHERTTIGAIGGTAAAKPKVPQKYQLAEIARDYIGETEDGKIADPAFRDEIIRHHLNQRAFQLTHTRSRDENESGRTLGSTTSIFKAVGANLLKRESELQVQLMGSQGTGWEGDTFDASEISATRGWLEGRAISIAGGTNEVQFNIIAKRVLGLPD